MKKGCTTCLGCVGVFGIVFLIAAILFPVFEKAREKMHNNYCPSNMKQMGLAIWAYAEDNDGYLPNIADAKAPNTTWRTMILPYHKSSGLYQCPNRDDKLNGPDGFPRSYAANYTGTYSGRQTDQGDGAFAGANSKPIRRKDIKRPESLIVVCEVWHHSTPDFNIDNLGAYNPGTDMLYVGHASGSNYLFADGHVKYLRPLATKTYWHRDISLPLSAGSVKILQNAGERGGK